MASHILCSVDYLLNERGFSLFYRYVILDVLDKFGSSFNLNVIELHLFG